MRIGHMLSLSAAAVSLFTAVAISQLALAAKPIDGGTLGHLEAVVGFCSKVHPQAAAKYQQQMKYLTAKVSEAEIVKTRKTQEYQRAYEAIGEKLGKVPKEQASEACAAALESKG